MNQGTESPEGVANRVLEALPAILRAGAQPPKEGTTLRYADGRQGTSLNEGAGDLGARQG